MPALLSPRSLLFAGLAVTAACIAEEPPPPIAAPTPPAPTPPTVTGYKIHDVPAAGEGRFQIVSDLPHTPMRVRIDGQFLVREADNGQLAYAEITAPNSGFNTALPAGDHVVELVDETDQVWLTSDPVTVTEGTTDIHQAIPTWMVAWGERGATEYLAVDPLASDGDINTVEISAANRTDRTVILERCYVTANGPTAPNVWDCARPYILAPGQRVDIVEATEWRRYPDRVENLFARFADQPEHGRTIVAYLAADLFASRYPVVGILVRGAFPVPQEGGFDMVGYDVNWPAGPGPTEPL